MTVEGLSEEEFTSFLKFYYENVFPFDDFYKWLSYGQSSYFGKREFSFTLANDVYLRFQSFANSADMKAKIVKLVPHKIDIGGVYSARPMEKRNVNAAQFKALEKELVFDIDLTDYDEIRNCCRGKGICEKCWKFVCVAVKVIDTALEVDFGLQNRLWVYSGRRGVHCWVSDQKARKMNANTRKALLSYLEVIKGGAEQRRKVILSGDVLHPHINRSLKIAEGYFRSIIEEQNAITEDAFIQLLPLEDFRNYVIQNASRQSPTELWDFLDDSMRESKRRNALKGFQKNCREEIILQYTYPRIDINVSLQVNHLLKSPFCVHPATGRVCVPFRAQDVDSFNPATVPTLSEIYESPDKGQLVDAFKIFHDFLEKLNDDKVAVEKATDADNRMMVDDPLQAF